MARPTYYSKDYIDVCWITAMGTRSVRLDEEAESALADIIGRTGLSVSEVIKNGLMEYRESSLRQTTKRPSAFFKNFDLGEGGYSIAPAREAKQVVKTKLKNGRSDS